MKVEHRLDKVSKSKVPNNIVYGEILEQIKNKDLSHTYCYNFNKYGHYARECRNSKKRNHEASIPYVEEYFSQKKTKNEDRTYLFFQNSLCLGDDMKIQVAMEPQQENEDKWTLKGVIGSPSTKQQNIII